MTMDSTLRWALPQLFAGQAQKELFHNEALARIDMLLHGAVESADQDEPPASPAVGACWIVAAGAGGAWEGQDGALACWTEGGWRFAAPREGLSLWVADRGHAMRHDGAHWEDCAVRADGFYVGGERVVGAAAAAIADPAGGATVDMEARSALAAILGALRTHGLIAT
ncbi:hypothetical protein Sj15T_04010 [Sphingobium sp. TA15]|uniref:DUF2793 domain-containing protein n=3 Tax=Sphingobium indicum TaxID=332055 RepID=D4Z0E1_SPHIU|nr:DUF2793 domain-containing protein [Sphingobium indicum]KEY99767.1 hypothetical protein AI27_01155 [Sphingomonas sp. BHC-A]BDD65380.1 hypothetical protein Sj15T_04010 [Sphingobium sp. TA15]APL94460.1 hypothetical protein SIDU_08085 [Sphingobium indicum B90A]NYI23417.1 hypothetical protein [Sphingobium indicum]RYM04206.1 DUF2793 domain-containing protein [Sphingobium indicum]